MAKRTSFKYFDVPLTEAMRTSILKRAKSLPEMLIDIKEVVTTGDKLNVIYNTSDDTYTCKIYGYDKGKNRLRGIKSDAKRVEVAIVACVTKWQELGGVDDWANGSVDDLDFMS